MSDKQERRNARKKKQAQKAHDLQLLTFGWGYMLRLYGCDNPSSRKQVEHAVHHMQDSRTLPSARKYVVAMTPMQRDVFFDHYQE